MSRIEGNAQYTVAKSLDGKLIDSVRVPDENIYDAQTGIFTFSDGSRCKILTVFEETAPFVTLSLSTSRLKHVKKWMAI